MELAGQWLLHAGEALLKAALNPFSCLGWLLLALLCRRRTELERKLFSVRLHNTLGEWARAFGAGLAGALCVSLAAAGLGLRLTADAVYWTWGVLLVLLPFRLRFAQLPLAAAVVGVLQSAVRPVHDWVPEGIRRLSDSLLAVDLPSLWGLTALLLAAQAVLVRVTAGRSAMPLYMKGKRGKAVGAYQLKGLWLMPLVLAVPASGEGASRWLGWMYAATEAGGGLAGWLPWPPLFADGAGTGGWMFLAFPALAGFVDMTVSELPSRRAKRLAWRYAAWSLVAGAAAAAALLWPVALPVTAAVVLLVPEVWQAFAERTERGQSPRFVNGGRGLTVLDVLAGSPAAEMGIVRGETVVKANGIPVDTPDELHAALRANPAFSRLEVIDLNGQNRFVQRALYSGEHHQLGLMLCPDDGVLQTIRWRPLTLWQLFRIRTIKHRPLTVLGRPLPEEKNEPSANPEPESGDGPAEEAASGQAPEREAAAAKEEEQNETE